MPRFKRDSPSYPEAAVAFRASFHLEPSRLTAVVALLHTSDCLGAVQEAIDCARQAIRLSPNHAAYHMHLGNLLSQTGNLLAAEAAYVQADRLNPSGRHVEALQKVRTALAVGASSVDQPPSADQVMVGSEGWLFHRVDNVFRQVCGGSGLSNRNLIRMISLWEARQAWCMVRGADYRVLIVPERHVVYPDKLPSGYAPHPDRPALRLIGAAGPDLRPCIVYPVETLQLGRATRETFYKTDVHWTQWGAYLAYRELMLSIPRCVPQLVSESELEFQNFRLVGSMTRWLDDRTRERAERTDPPKVDVDEVFTNRTFKIGQVDVYETPFRDLPKLVLFRTSNSTYLLPFLYHHFSRIVAVAGTPVRYDLLRSEKPDVVISEISERYLAIPLASSRQEDQIVFPEDFSVGTFEDYTGVKLPLPTGRLGDSGSS
jgi:hypothetical protein